MQFSRPLKSSAHSLPSPNGKFIASIINSKLTVRTTRSLTTFRTVPLHENFVASIRTIVWSQSSERVLIYNGSGTIRIFSAVDPKFSALIKDPTSETAKPTYICFGGSHGEVVVFTDFGLKLTIFNLETKTSIDILGPKLWQVGNATKGFAYRPRAGHFALLTRRDGKDVVSVHKPGTYEVLRSWNPQTLDAQQMSWSGDGKWLAVIESAGQGHKLLFYTADGHLFKIWKGPRPSGVEEGDLEFGAGVRCVEWTSDGRYLVVADFSSKVTLLSIPTFTETIRLEHTSTIKPSQGLQVWQENVLTRAQAAIAKVEQRQYNEITQIVCPPTSSPSPGSSISPDSKIGTASLAIDASGTLIASRNEGLPTTVFIWDIASKILKAVLIQHSPVAKIRWHKTINELLLIRCEGDDKRGLVYLWEPTWEAPKIVDFEAQLPESKVMGKTIVRWLATEAENNDVESSPALFFTDTQDAILASLEEDSDVPWNEAKATAVDIYGQAEESPPNIIDEAPYNELEQDPTIMSLGDEDVEGSEMDDTFDFKKSSIG